MLHESDGKRSGSKRFDGKQLGLFQGQPSSGPRLEDRVVFFRFSDCGNAVDKNFRERDVVYDSTSLDELVDIKLHSRNLNLKIHQLKAVEVEEAAEPGMYIVSTELLNGKVFYERKRSDHVGKAVAIGLDRHDMKDVKLYKIVEDKRLSLDDVRNYMINKKKLERDGSQILLNEYRKKSSEELMGIVCDDNRKLKERLSANVVLYDERERNVIQLFSNEAVIYEDAGRFDKAIESYKVVAMLRSEDRQVVYTLGRLHTRAGDKKEDKNAKACHYEEAMKCWENMINLNPNDQFGHVLKLLQLDRAYMVTGSLKERKGFAQHMNVCLSIFGQGFETTYHLSKELHDQGLL